MTKILIVDDRPETRELLAVTFEITNYQLFFAEDGVQALALAQREQPDLALLDIIMPNLSGLEVCRRFRADPALAGMVIILLSAKGQATDIAAGLAAGADGYITKPFSPLALLDTVQERLSGDFLEYAPRQLCMVEG